MTAVRSSASLLVAALAVVSLLTVAPSAPERVTAVEEAVEAFMAGFVPNRGQAADDVRFHSYASEIAFTPREARIGDVRLHFVGADETPAIEAAKPSATRVSYFVGADPSNWVTRLPSYGEVVYRGLWPGVDLAFAGDGRTLKYEARVAAGSDAAPIRLSYPDARRLSLGPRGNLRIHTAGGVLTEAAPRSYQVVGGRRVTVASRFVLHGRSTFGFALGPYDPALPLVIDPALHYSTFYGSSLNDVAHAVTVDAAGNAYVTGSKGSFSSDVFVAKLSPGGDGLVYAAFVAGSSFETGKSIGVDAAGNAYVVGETGSSNFPTTPGAYDRTFGSFQDPFALKLAPDGGALLWSTFLGGTGSEGWVRGHLSEDGGVYVTGSTSATTGIVPAGVPGYKRTIGGTSDGFVQRLNPQGSGLLYATYVGGSRFEAVTDLALGAAGRMYLTGYTSSADFATTDGAYDRSYNGPTGCCVWGDAYVVALDGETLAYGSFLGGRGDDQGFAVAVGPGAPENVYVTGTAGSLTCCTSWFSDFPVTPGAFDTTFSGINDPFVARIDPYSTGGSQLVWSTFVGGSACDNPSDVRVTAAGDAFPAGMTCSFDFPTTPGAVSRPTRLEFSASGAWVSWLSADGARLRWSSLLEGPRGSGGGDETVHALALDAAGTLYAAGYTTSHGFPVTPWAYDTSFNGGGGFSPDAFVSKLAITPQAQLSVLAFEIGRAAAAGQLTKAQASQLASSIDSATREIERRSPRSASDHLRSFIGHVNNAAKDGPLPAEDALFFMEEATNLILFVDFWLAGAGAPGAGAAGPGLQDAPATVDVLVPAGLDLLPGETLTVGPADAKPDGLEAGCVAGGASAYDVEVAAPGIAGRSFGVVVVGDVAAGTQVANLTPVGTCSAAGRSYTIFRGNPG